MRALLTTVVVLCLAGCSGAPSEGPDFVVENIEGKESDQADSPPAAKSKAPKESEDETEVVGTEGPAVPAEPEQPEPPKPPPPPKEVDMSATYKGTLGSSPGAGFSSSSCRYTVTMKNINVEVTTNKNGDVTNAVVRNFMMESTPGCKTPLIPSHNQEYRFGYADKTGNGWKIGLTPAPQNQPKANVTLDLVTKSDGFDTGITWHRYDQSNGSLNYTVKAQTTLRKQ